MAMTREGLGRLGWFLRLLAISCLVLLWVGHGEWVLTQAGMNVDIHIDIYPAKVGDFANIPDMGRLEDAGCESDRMLYLADPPMQGEDVAELQRGLWQLRIFPGQISQKFDRETMQAVLDFQRQQGLRADGVVGPETWQSLADNFPVPAVDTSQPVPEGEREIVIDVARRQLIVYIDGVEYQKFPVAVGLSKTPSPIGEFRIVHKSMNWGGGFGSRWLGLNVPWGIYGIHGTNKPWSIGTQASGGCIRMFNRHVEQLFRIIPEGTLVRMVGRSSDPVTRQLKPGSSGQDVITLQLALRENGYDAGIADGRYGEQTAAAIKRLQERYGLVPDGLGWPDVYLLLGVR
ncbi:MAG: L,D-transpeptidase family protein [Firmicutes bacterium]|nr:L,D-transpeptidase family protein [Bacillota bacterium]